MSIAPPPTPTASAAAPARPAASIFDTTAQPLSTSPMTLPPSTSTPEKSQCAAIALSTSRTESRVRPAASVGTAKTVRPCVSPADPEVRATTISASAEPPCRTARLRPSSRKPLPDFSAVIAILAGSCLAPSSIAMPSTVSPATMPGSQRARRSSSAAASAVTPTSPVDRKGDGVRLRPISSITTPASTAPMPSPPSASLASIPAKPISPNWRHRSWPKPSLHCMSRQWRSCLGIEPSPVMNSCAVSRSIVWSSSRMRGIWLLRYPSESWDLVVGRCQRSLA